jgi:hypothetical protein
VHGVPWRNRRKCTGVGVKVTMGMEGQNYLERQEISDVKGRHYLGAAELSGASPSRLPAHLANERGITDFVIALYLPLRLEMTLGTKSAGAFADRLPSVGVQVPLRQAF